MCIPGGLVLQCLPYGAEVRNCRPRPHAERDIALPGARQQDEIAHRTLKQGGRKQTMEYPLEKTPPVICSWRGPRTPLHCCSGAAYDVPYQALQDEFKSCVVISDCELFWLRLPYWYHCQDGVFLWLRPWHQALYDGRVPRGGLRGYAFHVLVTGLRRGGWEPDAGSFFLEHPPHLGEWPVHYSRLVVWQLLLSTALGPAFCVCRPSYVTVRHSPPYQDFVLPSMWPTRDEDAEAREAAPRFPDGTLEHAPCAEGSSDGSFLSSLDMEV